MAKIVKGSDFKGVVNYILDKGKGTQVVAYDGLVHGKQRYHHHEFQYTVTNERQGYEACRTHSFEFL